MRDAFSIQAHIDNIEFQLDTIFRVIGEETKHFWSALVHYASCSFAEAKQSTIPGSIEDVHAQVGFA